MEYSEDMRYRCGLLRKHKPVQHRDGFSPWCDECGRDVYFNLPQRKTPIGGSGVTPPQNFRPEVLYFDEQTLFKVKACLFKAGIEIDSIDSVVNEMQNQGILFRERRQ